MHVALAPCTCSRSYFLALPEHLHICSTIQSAGACTHGHEDIQEVTGVVMGGRYVDRDGELRPARPPPGRQSSFLPAAAQAAEQQPGGQEEPADRS